MGVYILGCVKGWVGVEFGCGVVYWEVDFFFGWVFLCEYYWDFYKLVGGEFWVGFVEVCE